MSNQIPFRERISCSPKEACQATGFGLTFLYDQMKSGRLRSKKVDGKRVIDVASLLRLAGAESSTAEAA